MERKRNRLEVIRDILRVIKDRNGKIKPTHILYKSNLSYSMMSDYLNELIEKQLILEIKDKKGKTYAITDKGRKYLDQYNLVSEFTDSFGL